MEPESPWPYSQEFSNFPHSEPDISTSERPILCLQNPFKYYLPFYV